MSHGVRDGLEQVSRAECAAKRTQKRGRVEPRARRDGRAVLLSVKRPAGTCRRALSYRLTTVPVSMDFVAARQSSTAAFASAGVTMLGVSPLSRQSTKYFTSMK